MFSKLLPIFFSILIILSLIINEIVHAQSTEESNHGKPLWIYETDNEVYDVDISLDGNNIIASSDKLYLFSKNSSEPLWSNSNCYAPISISDDGKYIVSNGFLEGSYGVCFFSREKDTPLWRFPTDVGINAIAISANGDYIVAGTHSGNIYFFENNPVNFTEQDINIPINPPKWIYKANDWILDLDISSNGEYIVAGTDDYDGNLYLFSKDSNVPLWTYSENEFVNVAQISSNGEYITANPENNVIHFFSVNSNKPLWKIKTWNSIDSICISSDGDYVSFLNRGNMSVYSKESEIVQKFKVDDYIWYSDMSSDGQFIVAQDVDFGVSGTIYFFSRNDKISNWTYEINSKRNLPVAISGDGKYIVIGSSDGKIYLFYNEEIDKELSNNDDDNQNIVSRSVIIIFIAIGICLILVLVSRKKLKKNGHSNKTFEKNQDSKN